MAHTPSIPALGRQKQVGLCEFKATLGYTRFIQSQREQSPEVVAHTFNLSTWESQAFKPSTREAETGVIGMAGQREEYKAVEMGARMQSEN